VYRVKQYQRGRGAADGLPAVKVGRLVVFTVAHRLFSGRGGGGSGFGLLGHLSGPWFGPAGMTGQQSTLSYMHSEVKQNYNNKQNNYVGIVSQG
jgi:hypothetical protein